MIDVAQEKQCTRCKEWKPADRDHFTVDNNAKDGLYCQCKPCKYETRKKASLSQPVPLNGHRSAIKPVGTPDQCGSCGTTRGNILGDVDEDTRVKYGYLCAKCLQLWRASQGNLERMRNLVKYGEQTRLTIKTRRNKKVPATV